MGRRPELVGSGLIRSLEKWEEKAKGTGLSAIPEVTLGEQSGDST